MKSLPRLFAGAVVVLLVAVVILNGCSGPTSGKTITSIAVTPANPANLKVGSTQQFTATATFSDGSTADISATVTWNSSTTATATISVTGLATAVAVGTTQITASQGGKTSPAVTLTVIANKTIVSIAVTPATPAHLHVGATQQFTATATFSDTTTGDITATATWVSGTTATATISATGLATGVAGGTTQITAAQGGVTSPAVTLTVITLTSIAVTPPNPSIALGLTQQFTATGTFSDTSTADITATVMWKSLTAAVATINTAGLATSVSTGTSQITATVGAIVSPPATLTVTAAVATSLKITPANPTIAVGQTADFTAVELFTDGTTQTVPGPITWASLTPANASMTTDTTTNAGVATGLKAGTSTIKATFGALTGNTLLTVATAVPRFAYTVSLENGATSGYAVNSAAGALAPLPNLSLLAASPAQLVFEPSGQFAYGPSGLQNQSGIAILKVDPVSGNLSLSGLSATITSFVSGVSLVNQSAVDPTGRFLYVLDAGTGFVNSYNIDTSNSATKGSLTPTTAASTVATGASSSGIVVDPLGRFVYVTDAGGTIGGYSIGPDGSLTALPSIGPGPFTSLSTPQFPAIDPAGQFLFVPNNGGTTVSSFSIAASGQLTFINTATGLNNPFQAVVDPAGKFLYVTNITDGTVASIPITAGSLGAVTTSVTSNIGPAAATFPEGLAIDPTGTLLAVLNNGDNSVALFGVNPATGALSATPKVFETSVIPEFVSFYGGITAPVIGPSNVFAANSGSNNISGFTAVNTTGVLTAGTGSPTAGITGNTFLAAEISGNLLFTSSPGNKQFNAFNVTSSTAALSIFGAVPFTLSASSDAPNAIVTEPTSQFFFVGDTTGNNIESFTTANPPVSNGTVPAPPITSVNSITGDPQGTLLYALGSGGINPVEVNPLGHGALFNETALAQAGNWTSGAIDPSGHFLVALDSTGKTLQSFQISPVIAFAPSSGDGNLTAIGGPLPTAVTAPSSVTFDPQGRFVFVSDATNGTVTTFAFNGSTGAVTTTGKVTTVSATGTGRTSIDASGTYLYAAVVGNGGSTASAVAAYKINADGSLTAVAGSPFATGAGTSGTSDVVVTSSVK